MIFRILYYLMRDKQFNIEKKYIYIYIFMKPNFLNEMK